MTDTVSGPGSRRWLMLPVVLLAMFMAGFDIWVVNVAAPSLQRDLHVSDAALQLIVGGYAFMYASGMVTGGRLGDMVGYRRMFMIGVASFAVASLLCGLAQSPAELVGLNFALLFFFGSFMFALTLLLQAGLGQSPLRAGLQAGPLALAFTAMSILGPRMAARFGPWSITIGAGLDVLGTIGLVLTGLRYGSHLTGWDLAPATALIGLGQGMALPSLIGAALARVPPGRAGAAAGILTTAQQFGVASGVAVIGAVFYARLGPLGPRGPSRASSVPAMELAMAIDAVVVLAAAALTLLLPRRAAAPRPAVTEEPAAQDLRTELSARGGACTHIAAAAPAPEGECRRGSVEEEGRETGEQAGSWG